MKDALQAIAGTMGLTFDYAREDFANLVSELELGKTHCVLFPVKEADTLTEHGTLERRTTTGTFILLRRSDLDQPYSDANAQAPGAPQGKYEQHIAPAKAEAEAIAAALAACGNAFTIRRWTKDEVVNLFNLNLDGIYVAFEVQEQWPQ